MSRRTARVNDLLQEELSALIQRGLRDPRLAHGMTTITEVEVAPDLRNATVYVSYLGEESEREDVLKALGSASHHLHNELVRRLAMRNVPALHFRFDPSIERGARLAALINTVAAEHGTEPGDSDS